MGRIVCQKRDPDGELDYWVEIDAESFRDVRDIFENEFGLGEVKFTYNDGASLTFRKDKP